MDKKFASKLNFRVIWSTIDICQKSRKMSDTFSLWKQKILLNFLSNLFMTFQSLFYDLNTIVLREIQIIFNINFFNQVFEIQFFRLVENKLSWFDSSKSFEVIIIWNWLEYLMNSHWNKCNFLKMHIFRWFWLEKIENNWSNKNSSQISLTLILQYFVIIFHF